ncbi:MAG: hypothetical protein IJ438_10170 [Clostridia bacterium]|nr:hypothetical protein [Clostridia bacterium]
MLTAFFSRMHRHTRPAAYADKAAHARSVRSARPGAHGISFTGEFPCDEFDVQPVEATERRRCHVSGAMPGSYQPMGNTDAARMPAVNRYGVNLVMAFAIMIVAVCILGTIWLMHQSDVRAVGKSINAHYESMELLSQKIEDAELDIATYANDVAIRQQAVLLGLINAKGADVIYLTAPETAIITPASATMQSLASIAGQ